MYFKFDRCFFFKDLEENSPHCVSFLLTEEYMEIQHIFAALCKFLRINSNRLKDGECKNENGNKNILLTNEMKLDSICECVCSFNLI